jgi:hypothetical protein
VAEGELRNENEFSELETGGYNLLAEECQVVLVGVGRSF